MKSTLGWTMLSRAEMRQVERSLANSDQDTRDEIGVLLIHQGFADRFFPGTSVLHTRVRYALFVPWLYQRAAFSRRRGSDLDATIRHMLIELAIRLKQLGGRPRIKKLQTNCGTDRLKVGWTVEVWSVGVVEDNVWLIQHAAFFTGDQSLTRKLTSVCMYSATGCSQAFLRAIGRRTRSEPTAAPDAKGVTLVDKRRHPCDLCFAG